MSYAQGTITNANAGNVLAEAVHTVFLAAGWTLEDDLTVSPRRARVYKSAAASNLAGYDWFAAVRWNSTGTESPFEILCGRGYDPVTDSITEPCAAPGGTGGTLGSFREWSEPVTGAHASPYNVTPNLNQDSFYLSHDVNISKPWFWCSPPSTAFAYWISITLDHVFITSTIPAVAPIANHAYVAFTMDIDPAWTALPFAVNPNPVASMGRGRAISATVVGTSFTPADHVNPEMNGPDDVYGIPLPALSSDYFPAYAWRPQTYLSSLTVNDNNVLQLPGPRQVLIGEAIDVYAVRGGAIGDTVDILGATYVLTGPFSTGSSAVCYAALVE